MSSLDLKGGGGPPPPPPPTLLALLSGAASTFSSPPHARNSWAIAFYAHQGYSKVGTTYFVLGEERHENYVLIGPDA